MKTAINDVKLFDGENVLFEKGSVLFDETGILEIRDTAFSKSEADLRIDGSGKTLAPGLIDGHVHMGCGGLEPDYSFAGYAEDAAVTASQASEGWRYGITTLCDCGNGYESDITVRNMIRAGKMDGCRVLACGKGISITGGSRSDGE